MPPVLADALAALEHLEGWRGRVVTVSENISRAVIRGQFTYDRHFCTHSHVVFTLGTVGWGMSGSTLMLDGRRDAAPVWYQLTTDRLAAVERPDDATVVFVERFGAEAERRTTVRLVVGDCA